MYLFERDIASQWTLHITIFFSFTTFNCITFVFWQTLSCHIFYPQMVSFIVVSASSSPVPRCGAVPFHYSQLKWFPLRPAGHCSNTVLHQGVVTHKCQHPYQEVSNSLQQTTPKQKHLVLGEVQALFFTNVMPSKFGWIQESGIFKDELKWAGHKLEESDWSVIGKCCCYPLVNC